MILWSDSCVPQNRNSVMTTAIKHILNDDAVTVEIVEQKYSEAEHGLIQEIDAVHSKIEKGLRKSEIFSPVGLIRKLLALLPGKATLKIMQLKANDFLNFQFISTKFLFCLVPYTKVNHLIYHVNEPMHVSYRLAFNIEVPTTIRLNRVPTPRGNKKKTNDLLPRTPPESLFPKVNVLNVPVKLTAEKARDLKSMFKFMPPIDAEFYKAVCNL
jgi:hypothetical protein